MTWRMNKAHVEAKVDTINAMLGFDPDTIEFNTGRSIQLYHDGGGYAIHRVCNDGHGVQRLFAGDLRQCAAYLSGMIEATRMIKVETK